MQRANSNPYIFISTGEGDGKDDFHLGCDHDYCEGFFSCLIGSGLKASPIQLYPVNVVPDNAYDIRRCGTKPWSESQVC